MDKFYPRSFNMGITRSHFENLKWGRARGWGWCRDRLSGDGSRCFLGSDFDEFSLHAQLAQLLEIFRRDLALEIAPQDDGLAGKETLQSFGVVDGKHFAKAQLNPLRLLARQNFAFKREVEPVHPAPVIPCLFYSIPAQNVRCFRAIYQCSSW